MTIKVIFFSSWSKPDDYLKNTLSVLTPTGKPVWKDIIGVSNVKEADYYVILDEETSESSKLDNQKKIYFQREPDHYKKVRSNLSNYLFIGTYSNFYHVAVPWIIKPFYFLDNFRYSDSDHHLPILTLTSGKRGTYGHKARISFLQRLCQKNLPIDVYGHGLSSIGNFGGKLKGELQTKCKFDLQRKYRYCLVFENGQQNNYFTEKLVDCYLSLTFPIYWGCPNVSDYFPDDSFIAIDISKPEQAIHIIKQTITKELTESQINALYLAKDLVLKKYNIWPSIERILKNKKCLF